MLHYASMRIKERAVNLLRRLNPLKIARNWWKMRGIKKWLLFVVFCVVLFVSFRLVLGVINRGKPDLGKYDITTVTKQDLTKTITKEGILHFAGVVDYPMPASGIITHIWVENVKRLKTGKRY